MTADRSLRPADAAVACRSFPRRFRTVLARAEDEGTRVDPDEIARRVGPDGTSVADRLLAADGVLALLDGALEVAIRGHQADVTLHPAFVDLADTSWADPRTPISALLDQFEATATRTADRVDAVPAERWSAAVPVAGSEHTLEVIEAVQDAVDVAAGHLRAAERVMDAVV